MLARNWVVMALAGREAERLFFPEAALIPGADGGDIEIAREALDLTDGRHEMLLGIWLDGLRPAARALVRRKRDRIERLRDALLAHGSLDGAAVDRLCWGPVWT